MNSILVGSIGLQIMYVLPMVSTFTPPPTTMYGFYISMSSIYYGDTIKTCFLNEKKNLLEGAKLLLLERCAQRLIFCLRENASPWSV